MRISIFYIFLLFLTTSTTARVIELDLDRAVEIAMDNSYQIRQLKLGIERSRLWLQAEQAGLKSRVYMNVDAPEFEAMSNYKWDSVLGRDVIVRQNTQLWQAELSIRQPLILFGYPTNGYLSLNNRVYRYDQIDRGDRDINYYNRMFFKFEQPLFQPNRLKNDIENAELSLERNELNYLDDQVDLIEDIADDYYDLFRYAYFNVIYTNLMVNLEHVEEIANCRNENKENQSLDCIKIRVELNNARERLAQNKSEMRLEANRLKQRLRLTNGDSLIITPNVNIQPINVDSKRATDYATLLRPRLRLIEISKRQQEISLTNVKGWNSFRMNVEMTYGLENQVPEYRNLWVNEFDNSYSFAVSAYIPIWDWGQRRARVNAQQITIQKTELYHQQALSNIQSEVQNAVENLNEYQKRAMTMQETLEMAKNITQMSLEQYENGDINLQDLLQTINRQKETEMNFLEAYLGFRNSILTLMVDTYYDYENDIKLLDKYRSDSLN